MLIEDHRLALVCSGLDQCAAQDVATLPSAAFYSGYLRHPACLKTSGVPGMRVGDPMVLMQHQSASCITHDYVACSRLHQRSSSVRSCLAGSLAASRAAGMMPLVAPRAAASTVGVRTEIPLQLAPRVAFVECELSLKHQLVLLVLPCEYSQRSCTPTALHLWAAEEDAEWVRSNTAEQNRNLDVVGGAAADIKRLAYVSS
jgi:hypothetical protein